MGINLNETILSRFKLQSLTGIAQRIYVTTKCFTKHRLKEYIKVELFVNGGRWHATVSQERNERPRRLLLPGDCLQRLVYSRACCKDPLLPKYFQGAQIILNDLPIICLVNLAFTVYLFSLPGVQ